MSPRSEWITKQTILDNLQEPVFVVDADLEVVYGNERVATVVGQSLAEIRGSSLAGFGAYVESGYGALTAAIEAAIEGSIEERRVDVEMAHPPSAPVPRHLEAEARVTTLAADDGRTAALVVLRDITDRKDRERRLRQFENAVEHAGHAIFITDVDGTITYVNPAFEAMTGYDRADVIGETPALLNSGTHDGAFFADLWSTILDGEVWTGEIVNERADGKRFVAHQTIAPIEDDGEIGAFVAIHDEMTDRQLREQQLAVFHRVLRHNLRNKGTAIRGHADLLEDALPDDAPGEHVAVIQENVQSLLDVGEKAHYVRQILADTLEERAERSLATVLEGVTNRVASQYPNAEITLEGDLSESLVTDAKVVPALYELVENAVKHTDGAHPDVGITVTTKDGAARVAIADDGPGLPEHERAVIEAGTEDQLEHGSGLGLWFAYWLLNYVGGNIDIDVDAGGTTVEATMPLL